MNIPFVQRTLWLSYNFELLSLYLCLIIVRVGQGKLGKLTKVCLL